jgi:hypothetical protein
MIKWDAEKRPTAKQAQNYEFFTGKSSKAPKNFIMNQLQVPEQEAPLSITSHRARYGNPSNQQYFNSATNRKT